MIIEPNKDLDPYLWLMDPDPGGPKTCGSGGSGSATLVVLRFYQRHEEIWQRNAKLTYIFKPSMKVHRVCFKLNFQNTRCSGVFRVRKKCLRILEIICTHARFIFAKPVCTAILLYFTFCALNFVITAPVWASLVYRYFYKHYFHYFTAGVERRNN